jgi:large repetitive protein
MRRTKIFLLVALFALIVVPAAWALRFTDESYTPPVAETGKPYSWSFTGAGGCGPALPYQYRALNGAPPPGLTLDTSGLVHGIPTQAGDYSFWVELSDENPPSADWCRPSTAQREFTFHVLQGLSINQKQSALGVVALNAPWSLQLTATGAGTWTVDSGALPAGVALNSSTGLLSGTPTALGDFTFKIKITSGTRSDAQTYTLSVVQPLNVTSAPAAGAEVGLLFALNPQVSGGKPGYAWSIAEGTLPAGLSFDTATGAITGKPAAPGSYPLKLKVQDTLGLSQILDVPLVVSPRLLITKQLLKVAKVGVAYKGGFRATGGVSPRQWNLLGGLPGFLPPGMKLNKKTGALSGTPTKAGVYRLRMQVVDKLGAKSAAGFILKVGPKTH